jgi:hypothetical protein
MRGLLPCLEGTTGSSMQNYYEPLIMQKINYL